MTCSACGAPLPDDARFCEECGRSVPPPTPSSPAYTLPPSAAAYGAIEGRPTGRTFAFTVVGVAALVLGLVGFWYYKIAEERRLTQVDHPTLSAELDALNAATAPLERLAVASVPETKPEDYAQLVAEAKAAVERFHGQSKLGMPLPSGRLWPGQFTRCAGYIDDAIKYYPGIGLYLDQRAKAKTAKAKSTIDIDQNIVNVAGIAGKPLGKLTAMLEELERQRGSVSWVYDPPPRGQEDR